MGALSEVEMRFPAVIKVYLRLCFINTSHLLGRFFRADGLADGIHPSLSTACHQSKHKPEHFKMNPRSLTTAVRSFTRRVPLRPALPAARTFAPQLQARAYSEEKEFHEKEDKRIADLEAAKAESDKKAAEFEEKVKELTVSHHFLRLTAACGVLVMICITDFTGNVERDAIPPCRRPDRHSKDRRGEGQGF